MSTGLATLLQTCVAGGSCRARSSVDMLDAATLDQSSAEIARQLVRCGATQGEPVVVSIDNRAADIASLFGAWRAGVVAMPVHASTPPAVVGRLQAFSGARFMIGPGGVQGGGKAPPPRPLLRDAALIVQTSGSTGSPKGVVVGHERFAGKLQVLQRLLQFRADDVVLVPLQLTFIFGIWVSLLALLAGAQLILMQRFSASAMADALRSGVTVAGIVPTMLRSSPADAPIAAPALRMLLTGGEPFGATLASRMAHALPRASIFDLYGCTETGSCDFCLPVQGQTGVGSIGAPTEHVAFKIIAESGQPAEPGDPGELWVRTPYRMLGYLDDPEATAAAFSDGYFRTGDLARVRKNGFVELVGRRKDIISRGGVKIAPLELDDLFASHPDVAAALCGGVPDARLGETVHLFVVPRKDAVLDQEQLKTWAAARLEKHKLPDAIHFTDALPLGRTGKADRSRIANLVNKQAKA